MAITSILQVGDRLAVADILEIRMIPVDKTNPMPDNTIITRVSLIDLGRKGGYRAIHFGGNTGPMYKNIGTNLPTQDATIVAIYEPK